LDDLRSIYFPDCSKADQSIHFNTFENAQDFLNNDPKIVEISDQEICSVNSSVGNFL